MCPVELGRLSDRSTCATFIFRRPQTMRNCWALIYWRALKINFTVWLEEDDIDLDGAERKIIMRKKVFCRFSIVFFWVPKESESLFFGRYDSLSAKQHLHFSGAEIFSEISIPPAMPPGNICFFSLLLILSTLHLNDTLYLISLGLAHRETCHSLCDIDFDNL